MNLSLQADKIATILKAANVSCESYWPGLFAKLAEKKNIDDLIANVGAGGGGGGAPAAAAPVASGGAAAAAPVPEAKKVICIFYWILHHGLYMFLINLVPFYVHRKSLLKRVMKKWDSACLMIRSLSLYVLV